MDRSTLFECDLENEQLIARYSYATAGTERITTKFGTNLFPFTWETLQRGEVLKFSKQDELTENANIDLANFKEVDLKAGYIVPIIINGKLNFALAGGITRREEYIWPESLFPRIQLLGEILANALYRSIQYKKLNELVKVNQNLSSELYRIIPTHDSKHDYDTSGFLPDEPASRKKEWLIEGVKYFADFGKIDLNRICERMGLAKTSFYNYYPNHNDSKGLERFRKEILDYIFIRLSLFCSRTKHLIVQKKSESLNIEIIDLACNDPTIFRCMGQMMISKTDTYSKLIANIINSNFEELITLWLGKNTSEDSKSLIEKKGIHKVLLNNIYYQSLVSNPDQWKLQVISTLEHTISLLK